MKLSNNECQYLTASIEANLEDYITARIEVVLNCCGDSKFFEISNINNTSPTDKVYIDGEGNFIINPSFFGGQIVDGVYTVEISLYQLNGGSFGDTGCLFVDCELKCKVYEAVQAMSTEEEQTQMLMEHYSLTVGSNCSCECDKLCAIYKSLLSKVGDIDYDCGCV